MKEKYLTGSLLVAFVVMGLSSCKKDNDDETIAPYTVPDTYATTSASYAASTLRVNMMLELDTYLKSATTVKLSATKATDLFNNTNSPFTNAALNTAGINLAAKTADAAQFKGYIDIVVAASQLNTTVATKGTLGYIPRGTGKIIVGIDGVEYNQAALKGMMGSLFFKQAMDILSSVSSDVTIAAQLDHWDEAFGYLAVPTDYSPDKDYTVAPLNALVFPNKPALWGGYLAERGKNIDAGKIIWEAFRKGRAAIAAKDTKVRDQAIVDIQLIWEKLSANAAYIYMGMPQLSANVGNLGTQFHAMSEAYGFIATLKYRVKGRSKLSDSDYNTIWNIVSTNDFYALVNEPGFLKLKQITSILKAAYTLPD